jgi:hypothetical protein
MKLNLVQARQGTHWVKLGIQTFFRQPLALAGLFFMFLAIVSLVNLLPVIGNIVAMTLLPGATLGLMAASQISNAHHAFQRLSRRAQRVERHADLGWLVHPEPDAGSRAVGSD